MLTDTSYNISASKGDTQDVVKTQWPNYQKWTSERAFEYVASLACAGLLFFTAAKFGGVRTDVLLLPQRFYEGAGETREEKQLVGNNSNDARNPRPAYVNYSVTNYLLFSWKRVRRRTVCLWERLSQKRTPLNSSKSTSRRKRARRRK